jgi:hypothetical protein
VGAGRLVPGACWPIGVGCCLVLGPGCWALVLGGCLHASQPAGVLLWCPSLRRCGLCLHSSEHTQQLYSGKVPTYRKPADPSPSPPLPWLPPPACLPAVSVVGAGNVRFSNCNMGVNFADNMGGAGEWRWPSLVLLCMHCLMLQHGSELC